MIAKRAGFSLLSTLIGIGVLGIVVVGGASYLATTQKEVARFAANQEVDSFSDELSTLLRNPKFCSHVFGGEKVGTKAADFGNKQLPDLKVQLPDQSGNPGRTLASLGTVVGRFSVSDIGLILDGQVDDGRTERLYWAKLRLAFSLAPGQQQVVNLPAPKSVEIPVRLRIDTFGITNTTIISCDGDVQGGGSKLGCVTASLKSDGSGSAKPGFENSSIGAISQDNFSDYFKFDQTTSGPRKFWGLQCLESKNLLLTDCGLDRPGTAKNPGGGQPFDHDHHAIDNGCYSDDEEFKGKATLYATCCRLTD